MLQFDFCLLLHSPNLAYILLLTNSAANKPLSIRKPVQLSWKLDPLVYYFLSKAVKKPLDMFFWISSITTFGRLWRNVSWKISKKINVRSKYSGPFVTISASRKAIWAPRSTRCRCGRWRLPRSALHYFPAPGTDFTKVNTCHRPC